jgi:hypothetical protein
LNLAFSELETSLLDEQSDQPTAQVTASPASSKAIPEKTGPPTLDLNFDTDNIIEAETVPAKKRNRN